MKGLIPKMLGSVGIQIFGYSFHSSPQDEVVVRRSTESREFPLHTPKKLAFSFPWPNFCFSHLTLGPWNTETVNHKVKRHGDSATPVISKPQLSCSSDPCTPYNIKMDLCPTLNFDDTIRSSKTRCTVGCFNSITHSQKTLSSLWLRIPFTQLVFFSETCISTCRQSRVSCHSEGPTNLSQGAGRTLQQGPPVSASPRACDKPRLLSPSPDHAITGSEGKSQDPDFQPALQPGRSKWEDQMHSHESQVIALDTRELQNGHGNGIKGLFWCKIKWKSMDCFFITHNFHERFGNPLYAWISKLSAPK